MLNILVSITHIPNPSRKKGTPREDTWDSEGGDPGYIILPKDFGRGKTHNLHYPSFTLAHLKGVGSTELPHLMRPYNNLGIKVMEIPRVCDQVLKFA